MKGDHDPAGRHDPADRHDRRPVRNRIEFSSAHTDSCPLAWLVEDVGRYLNDTDEPDSDDAQSERILAVGRQAIMQGAHDVNALLCSAYASHEVVATELWFDGPGRGRRRTVFAEMPTPVALMLLCIRLCDPGDNVTVLHHTAAHGTHRRDAQWPFSMAAAEEASRPPSTSDDEGTFSNSW